MFVIKNTIYRKINTKLLNTRISYPFIRSELFLHLSFYYKLFMYLPAFIQNFCTIDLVCIDNYFIGFNFS